MNITVTGTVEEIIALGKLLEKGRAESLDVSPEERALIASSGIIVAIKEYRARTGRTLKDAKDACEDTPEGREWVANLRRTSPG